MLNKDLIILGIVFLAFLTSCHSEEEEPHELLRPVRTILIKHPNDGEIMQYAAVVDASQKANLSFKISGEVIDIFVRQGDEVKKGQILAKLNDTDIKLTLEEAQANFDKAKADYDRGVALTEKKVISTSELDQLKAQFSRTSAKLETAKNNLRYTVLRASFDGVIARKLTENFQEISAKQPIFSLHNLDEIHLKINVPESVIIQIPRNDTSRSIVAIFDDIPNQEFPAHFKEVSLQADEITKTYEVTFSMSPPKNHTILPGMTAILKATKKISSIDQKRRFYLPSNSVLKDATGNYVYIVEAMKNGEGLIKKLPVVVGEITSKGIEVFSGVNSGQYLVTAGVSKVSDGMKVKFSNAE